MASGSAAADSSRTKVRCTACGAKNGGDALCRICGTLLPGAHERRQVGNATGTFAEHVDQEVGEWGEHAEGRTSAEGKSRRPHDLPVIAPKDWAAAATGDYEPPTTGFGAAEAPAPDAPRPRQPRVRGGRGPIAVIVGLMLVALVVGVVVFMRRSDPAATRDRNVLVAAVPVTAGPAGTFAQTSLQAKARAADGLDAPSGSLADGCAGYHDVVASHATAVVVDQLDDDLTDATMTVEATTLDTPAAATALYDATTSDGFVACLEAGSAAQVSKTDHTVVVVSGSTGATPNQPLPADVLRAVADGVTASVPA